MKTGDCRAAGARKKCAKDTTEDRVLPERQQRFFFLVGTCFLTLDSCFLLCSFVWRACFFFLVFYHSPSAFRSLRRSLPTRRCNEKEKEWPNMSCREKRCQCTRMTHAVKTKNNKEYIEQPRNAGQKKKRMRNEQGDCFSVDAIAASCLLCFHTPRGVIYFLDERDGGDRLPADAASLDAVEMRGDVRCLGLMFERCSVFRALVFCLVFLCCQKLRFPGLFVVRLPVQ